MKIIAEHKQEILKLCIKYNVLQLFVFGSIAKGNYSENSDIDFMVYFKPDISLENYADNFFDFIHELESVFNRKIDMISGKAMKNPYFIAEVEQTKKLVYEHTNQKIAV